MIHITKLNARITSTIALAAKHGWLHEVTHPQMIDFRKDGARHYYVMVLKDNGGFDAGYRAAPGGDFTATHSTLKAFTAALQA